MKITIYDLLGLIKDGKAPKKIKVTGNIYEFDESYDMYYTHNTKKNYAVALGGMTDEINLIANAFNDNVEIIEEDKEKDTLYLTGVKTEYGFYEFLLPPEFKYFQVITSENKMYLKNGTVVLTKKDKEIKKITKRTNKVLKREMIFKINELIDELNKLKKEK